MTLVLHWHLDAVTDSSRAIDDSGNLLNGQVVGDPKNVPDPRFGSCLAFDGVGDAVIIQGARELELTSYTVEFWVRPADQRNTRLITGAFGNVGITNEGILAHRFGGTDQFAHRLALDSWQHVAVCNDGETARVYYDGSPVAEGPGLRTDLIKDVELAVGREGGSEGYFEGRLAHLRIYDGALSEAEIRRDMAEDEAALAAFVRSHPLDFLLSDEHQQPVLRIEDDQDGQEMTLRLTNGSRQDLLMAPGERDQDYQLALRFRPGTLADLPEPGIAADGWTLRRTSDASGTTLYLRSAGPFTLSTGADLILPLTGLKADGTGGTRGTRVELQYRLLRYAGESDELSGSRMQFLEVVNARGSKDAPITAGFVGGNAVLNDNVTPNTLRIRLSNLSRDRSIPLNPDSAFTVTFDVQEQHETQLGALTEAGKGTQVHLTATGAPGMDSGWHVADQHLGQEPVWTVRPQQATAIAPDGWIDLTLTPVVALSALGHADIVIGYQNIPGYADGYLKVTAERSPLIPAGSNVGIGTTAPEAKLHIMHVPQDMNGNALIIGPTGGANLRMGYHQNYSWIQSHGVRPLSINPIVNNVGIGTTAPEGRLQILHGPQDPNGNALIIGPTGGANLRIGYHQNYSWIQSHGLRPLLINAVGNNVGLGTANTTAKLTIGADNTHLQLRREASAGGGNLVFLEIYQAQQSTQVNPSLRFTSGTASHRIEARPDGLHLKVGDPAQDTYTKLTAGDTTVGSLTATTVTVGGTTLNATDFANLRRLLDHPSSGGLFGFLFP
ncbi:LamG domain-containing protein [Acrocarpospora catenulata]|uniref:LamG domain-containing protein n=1 Tax=Acrocarpospora catenulata TaxID=2836182 RepID=UPI001BDAE5DF|nr:LamG domain-containing protein [Acrocarpospora catenulata]